MQAGETCERVTVRWSGGGHVRAATLRRDACATQSKGRAGGLSIAMFGALAACCALTACTPRIGGSEGVDAANDALRAERETLEEKLRASELERDEWRVKAETLAGGGDGIKSLLMAIPAVVRLEIDPRSQIELSGEGAPKLNVSIVSLDGRGRFTPLVGELLWGLTTKAGQDQDPHLLSGGMLDAGAVRESYRSSFLGTRYVIEAEAAIEEVRLSPGETYLLQVVFIDEATGRRVRGEGDVKVVSEP